MYGQLLCPRYMYYVLYFTYNTLHTHTGLSKARYSYTQLYRLNAAIQRYTQLYRAMHSYTRLYTALNCNTQLYTAIQSYTELYTDKHSYTGLLKVLPCRFVLELFCCCLSCDNSLSISTAQIGVLVVIVNFFILMLSSSNHSLLLRFTDDTFDPDIGSTIGKS